MTGNTQDNQEYYREEDFEDMRKTRKPGPSGFAVFFTGIMAIAVLFLAVFLLFHVRKIEVSGNQYVSEKEVVQWIQEEKLATNSLYILFQQQFGKREELPLVENTVVSLKNPWTVHVTVHEKSIVGYLEDNGQRIYFDDDGGVVLIAAEEPMEGIPRVDGMDVDMSGIKEHEIMPIRNPETLKLVEETMTILKKTKLTPDSIIVTGSDISLLFGVVTVNLGDKDLETRIAQLPPVLSALNERYPGVGGIVHLENYNPSVKRIGFIPNPPAEEQPVEETQQPAEGTAEEWVDPATEQWTDPATEQWVDPTTEQWVDPTTEQWVDPTTEQWVDPATGQ